MQLNLFENFNSELKYQALNTNLIESTKVAQEKSNRLQRNGLTEVNYFGKP